MSLNYYTPQAGVTPRYSGDIARWTWQQGSDSPSHYTFTYDPLSRLTNAVHSSAAFNEALTYDRNGNIQTIRRTGNDSDNFTLGYMNNKMITVNGVSGYTYDWNGNMTVDPRKSLKFQYNHLNLIETVTNLQGTGLVQYGNSADGQKLQSSDLTQLQWMDYLGSLTLVRMNGGHSAEYNFGEGVIIRPWGPYQVVYHEKDHVGSVRVATNQHGDVLERNDYYPFGMRHRQPAYELSTVNRYQFNGKDKEPYGLTHLSDYGARHYDSQLGRWNEMDPLREKYYSHSPFSFSGNNPVRNIDPDGRDWYSYLDQEDYTEEGEKKSREVTRYAFHDRTLSQQEMSEKGYMGNVGLTHSADGTYYSLLGGMHVEGLHQTNMIMESDRGLINGYYSGKGSGDTSSGSALGTVASGSSILFGIAQEAYFSNTLGTWMGKDFTIRSQSWGGNQFTGGKLKFASRVSSAFKFAGYVGTGASVAITEYDFRSGNIGQTERVLNHVANGVSLVPFYGTVYNVFYELGKSYGPSKW